MLKPAKTFYVSLKGSDKNDGKSLKNAFRTIEYGVDQLRAGDTLLIEEGEYFEREISINLKKKEEPAKGQNGLPGSPIRIMGMKGHKVTLTGARLLPLKEKEGNVYKFKFKDRVLYNMVQEYPSGIELQRVFDEKLVHDYPGTFFYDEKRELLLAHLASLEQTHVAPAARRTGLRIYGSYIHIENLTFRSFNQAVFNPHYGNFHPTNISIENCTFYHNYKNGIVFQGATRSLIRGNRFHSNTGYGGIMNQTDATHNLVTGNWFGFSAQTCRNKVPHDYEFGYSNYGKTAPVNHVISNIFESPKSFRWKAGCPDSIVRDNILLGNFYAESPVIPCEVTNNVIKGKVGWKGLGFDIWEKDFKNTPINFHGNFRSAENFRKTPELAKAEALALPIPEIKFPAVTFKNLKNHFSTADSTAVSWETPGCDGKAEVEVYDKRGKLYKTYSSNAQGMRHIVGVTRLAPGRTYKYRAVFINRRGGRKSYSEMKSFTTPLKTRAPQILEVGEGKLTLAEAAAAAIPGDTVKLLPGVHKGFFEPLRSGRAGKPITLTGEGKATMDGQYFYAPMINLKNKHHIIIDGVKFLKPESTVRQGIIRAEGGSNVTIRNCHAPRFSDNAGPFALIRNVPGTLIENNIIHGGDYPIATVGKNIKIKRNTIVDATMISLSLWDSADLEITDNIFYRPCVPSKRNPALTFFAVKGKIVSEGNVFWSPHPHHPAGGRFRDGKGRILKDAKTLEEWRKISGLDKTSIHADPMFVDYKKGDFRLKPGSPAKGKGATL